MGNSQPSQSVSPWRTGIACRCPACGKGKLYDGLLSVKEVCDHCEFPLRAHDHGDGAAFFVIIILNTLVMALALWLELAYEPPLWVHGVIWFPVIVIGTVGGQRILKSLLISLQYAHRANDFEKVD